MRSKFIILFFILTVFGNVNAYALDSDLNYSYKTENKEEFVTTGKSGVNIKVSIFDYLWDIYDLSPQTLYNSDYGANVIEPKGVTVNNTTYAPYYAPVESRTASQRNTVSGNALGTEETEKENTASKIPEITYTEEKQQYPVTSVEKVRNSDGSIGVLSIPKINLKVTAYDGDTFTAMKKGVGHIASTSSWNGNIGLVGHNRGTNNYFGKLKNLSVGDEMTYSTNLGKRTYVVKSISKISDTDWSRLQYTHDNRLTMITCVENVGDQRLCVQAVEKK